MKKNLKKLSLALFFSMMFVLMLATTVSAATKPWTRTLTGTAKTIYKIDRLKPGEYHRENLIIEASWDSENATKNDIPKITCKSSNPKVATIEQHTYSDYGYANAYFFVKGTGTTTIKTTIKYKGKTWTYSTKLTVKKWVNPFKSIKIGSKTYTDKFKTTDLTYTGNVKGKLVITPADGWTISSIKYTDPGNGNLEKIVNNNSIINMKTDTTAAYLKVTMRNKKTGLKEVITLKKFEIFG